MLAAAALLIAKLVLAAILVPRFGLAGLALTTPLVFGIAVVGMHLALRTTLHTHHLVDADSAARIGCACAAMVVLMVAVNSQLTYFAPAAKFATTCAIGMAAYVAVVIALRLPMAVRIVNVISVQPRVRSVVAAISRRHNDDVGAT
jgi:O-antigen/teichoic acid export membrane protein